MSISIPASASAQASPSLYVFTTSQSSLPVRYSRPRKPVLQLPALIHRTLHSALDGDSPSVAFFPSSPSANGGQSDSRSQANDTGISGTVIIPHPDSLAKQDLPGLPQQNGDPYAGSRSAPIDDNVSANGPRELETEPVANQLADSELTVKLHLVGLDHQVTPVTTLVGWIKEALVLLEENKGLSRDSIDTLLLGFKGVDYRGSKTAASEMFGCGTEGLEAPNTESIPGEYEDKIIELWNQVGVEGVVGKVTKLGSLYAPLGLLKRLVENGSGEAKQVKVNALDTPDCHHLPKEYTNYARGNGVELWAGGGGEGSDPLPSSDLHNLLSEFVPKLKGISSEINLDAYANKLEKIIPLREDGLKFVDVQDQRGVDVRWVLSYTLVSKTRNVVKDKGYIVAADFTL